ncbi:enhancer of mRNA-decapping protein 4 [Fopius arisanus]|uniref:Enhancer of mRNA-decapping protein 4 n=1 Tax=Fopius arisanus TaxID=64838 RepID=A0A9R1T4T2_9HYME|nr:PREDICTED: enhancer of mRNA-decapping protein 4 [Fopius arisanus]XP_011302814.1 PREDICTED: enhancer of mRNA-decapping protein 4 [Fopius arisanus]
MIKTGEEGIRPFHQTVELHGTEDQHSVEIYSSDVTVIPSPGGHDHGSSKVKLKNIVDFTWEPHFYTGQLLAVHMSGKYLAYGIKSGSGAGVVRVVYKDLEQRALLRGMQGAIQDLAFAHSTNAILACVDYLGSVFVHTIVSSTTQLVCNLQLHIVAGDASPMSYRVIWCPYIPDEEPRDDDETRDNVETRDDVESRDGAAKLLIVTRGASAELWSVDSVFTQLGSGPIKLSDPSVVNCGGFTEICKHQGAIVEAILSPDGTAIATASLDGEVKFFQVNLIGSTLEAPSCLHMWQPHQGRAISSLFFLDDHKNCQEDAQFWRFAITGCDNNSELKIWSCEKWVCLQTIKFQPSPTGGKSPVLKAGLDLAAGFLLLSDIANKALYILSLSKNTTDSVACVASISEFLLPYSILSFAIVDAGLRKVRPTGESLEDLCPCEDECEDQMVIRMYLVQPKSLQECHIAFQPAKLISNPCLMDTLTHDSLDYTEDLQHIHHEQNGINEDNGEESVTATIEANHSTSLNLMTPDAFSSPAKKDNISSSTSPELGNVLSASPSLSQAVQALNIQEAPLATSEIEQAPPSGGSSPSREVREILSLAEPDDDDDEEEEMKEFEAKIKNEGNWSNIPMVRLKDVQVDSQEPGDIKREDKSMEMILATQSAVNTLSTKLDGILQVLQDQRRELNEIRGEMITIRQDTPISARVESALARATQQQLATIEQSLYTRLASQNDFLGTVEGALKKNIESILPRVVSEVVAPVSNQMINDFKRVDELLKDNLTQLIGGAHMRDLISLSVASSAKPALDNAFRESFSNVLLPGIEKACHSMFRQIQDAFAKGTREYLQHIEQIVEKVCQRRNEQQSEALSNLVREELRREMTKGLGSLQDGILRSVKESVKDNLGQHLIDIQARSRATTPGITVSSPADAQVRVMSLLQRGQLNAAFQQALSASDLGLVVYVCEKTEPARVFPGPGAPGQNSRCLLQQPVILSLVQQLSADLGHRTELKHKWLEEAILNLDPTDPVTREHMGTVLMTLQTQLASFVAANPNVRTTKGMKMLAMAARALLLNQHQ